MRRAFVFLIFISLLSCSQNPKIPHLLNDVTPALDGELVNMVVEIPTGSIEKWEVNKITGRIERDSINGQPRTVDYLGYPGNYGFIPQTLLPKAAGGDGDPLDVLVIGAAVERGTILRCKIIGILKLLDNGERDDKLIAIAEESKLSTIDDLQALKRQKPGVLEIIETWFINYKGEGLMESNGFSNAQEAQGILITAIEAF